MSDFATLDLRIRNNQFNSGVDNSMGKLNGLTGVATVAGTAIAGIFALKRGAGIAKSLLDMSADAEEIRSKYSVVFRDLSAGAEQIANDFAKNFDLAGSSARRLLADTGDLLTGFGFTQEQALSLAEKTNSLAGDLASFTNIEGGTAKASQALTKALVGETEQAKALGIVIRQNSQEFKDSVKYYMESEGATILQAKALTALDIAVSQSQNAIGDYQRTRESEANATRAVSEAYKDLQETLGATISDAINYSEILAMTAGALEDTAKWVNTLDDSTKSFLIRSGLLTIAVGASIIAYKTLATAIQLKNAVLAKGSAITATDTVSTSANTMATIANATAQKMQAKATGGAMGKLKSMLSPSASLTKKMGTLGGKLQVIGGIATSAFVGWEIGRAINKVTGLDAVLSKFYGEWFYNDDEATARGLKADQELSALGPLGGRGLAQAREDAKKGKPIAESIALTKAQIKENEKLADAQKRFDDTLFDRKVDQAKIEEKINLLYDKRTKLATEAFNAETRSDALDINTEKLRIEHQIADLKNDQIQKEADRQKERDQAFADSNKPILENTLVDAIEKGSMEALRLESRQIITADKAPAETAKNTKVIADEIKKLNRNNNGGKVNLTLVTAI